MKQGKCVSGFALLRNTRWRSEPMCVAALFGRLPRKPRQAPCPPHRYECQGQCPKQSIEIIIAGIAAVDGWLYKHCALLRQW
jgi:hypothetical protein